MKSINQAGLSNLFKELFLMALLLCFTTQGMATTYTQFTSPELNDRTQTGTGVAPTVFKLSDRLQSFQGVAGYGTSKDGSRVIYQANTGLIYPKWGLYMTDRRGGTVTKLTPEPTGTSPGVFGWIITADSNYAVFSFSESTTQIGLYSVNLNTLAVHQLHGPLVPGGGVVFFKVSNDSSTVVYCADQRINGVDEVFSVPIDGGEPVCLHQPLVKGQSMWGFDITPDSQHVVLSGVLSHDAPKDRLYCAPIHGGAKLVKIGATGEGDYFKAISPDSKRVVFTSLKVAPDNFDLYSVAIDGSNLRRLSPDQRKPSKLGWNNYYPLRISPDSRDVVYRSDHNVNGRFELFAVKITGGKPRRLSERRKKASNARAINIYNISKNGIVLFSNDRELDFKTHLYSASLKGGKTTQVTHNYLGPTSTYEDIGDDGESVIYRARDSMEELAPTNLYIATIDGSQHRKVNPDFESKRGVSGADVSSDNQWIVYDADQDIEGVIELFRVPLKGGVPVRLNQPVTKTVGSGRGRLWFIMPDSKAVIYNADAEIENLNELYSATLPIEIPMDINPASCPNNVDLKSMSPITVALPGVGYLDFNDIIPASIRLANVPSSNVQFTDVSTPYAPAFGKTTASQCSDAGADGVVDMQMDFSTEALSAQLEKIPNGAAIAVELMAILQSGGSVISDDIITINK